MKRVRNKSLKGKRLEKFFAQKLKELFPSSETEIKPRIINIKKDFWGLFDGLTFIKSKKKFIFWQIKGKKITNKEKIKFWNNSKIFQNFNILVLLIEKHNNKWKIFYNSKNYLNNIKEIKKLL